MGREKTRKVMRLRQLRRSRELTQTQLASRVGVSVTTIVNLEKGTQRPTLDTAKGLAAVFDVSAEALFEYVEVPA